MRKASQLPLSTCPRCDDLCVGPSILPCSHLLCRKCLLLLLDTQPGKEVDCPTCHSTIVPTRTTGPHRQVKHFPIDVVMESLVMEKLTERAGGRCCVPHPSSSSSSSHPTHVCLECGEVFCDRCAHVHRNISSIKGHTLKPLTPPLTHRGSPSGNPEDDTGGDRDNQDNLLQQAVNTEMELFQQAMTTCDLVIDGLKDLLMHRQDDRHVLEAYSHHVLQGDVSLNDDVHIRRSRQVREECTLVAEADMDILRQMRSRQVSGEKAYTQDISLNRRTWKQRLFPRQMWTSDNMTLWMTLSVLVILLLALLMVTVLPDNPSAAVTPLDTSLGTSPADGSDRQPHSGAAADEEVRPSTGDAAAIHDNDNDDDASPNVRTVAQDAPAVPYTADKVVLQPLKAPSSSLTGSPCGGHGCSSHYDDGVFDILVTTDRRVVLLFLNQQIITVESSSGVQTVELGCRPVSLTQLPSGLLAVTCPRASAVALVNLDSKDHQIQLIQTGKWYWAVTAHPTDDALIVGDFSGSSVDIITLQGEVIQILVDSNNMNAGLITSLTVANGHLLVTDSRSGQVHRIQLSGASPPHVEVFAENFASSPRDTAVDRFGNVFVVLYNGGVVMRSPEGHYRSLLKEREGKQPMWSSIALCEDRLLVTTGIQTIDSSKTEVTEYRLLDP